MRSDVDPRELQINRRFRNSQAVPPEVKAAQERLIIDIKQHIPDDFCPSRTDIGVTVVYYVPNRKSDVDGPGKRVLDALQIAMKAKGFEWWHDGLVDQFFQIRRIAGPHHPQVGVELSML